MYPKTVHLSQFHIYPRVEIYPKMAHGTFNTSQNCTFIRKLQIYPKFEYLVYLKLAPAPSPTDLLIDKPLSHLIKNYNSTNSSFVIGSGHTGEPFLASNIPQLQSYSQIIVEFQDLQLKIHTYSSSITVVVTKKIMHVSLDQR